jgi:hypothetical protein
MALAAAPRGTQETGTLIQRKAAQIQDRGKNAARLAMESFAECLVSRSCGRISRSPVMASSRAACSIVRAVSALAAANCSSTR